MINSAQKLARIDSFEEEYSFLSNYHRRPIIYQSKEWPTVEHAYQAMKTNISAKQEMIRSASTPAKAKEMGAKIHYLRTDWDEIKPNIMEELLCRKFSQHPDLGERLLATGNAELIEGNNWHDNYWGNCSCQDCASIIGKNALGKLLMKIREELKEK